MIILVSLRFSMIGRYLTKTEQGHLKIPADVVVWHSNSIGSSNELLQKMQMISQWVRKVANLVWLLFKLHNFFNTGCSACTMNYYYYYYSFCLRGKKWFSGVFFFTASVRPRQPGPPAVPGVFILSCWTDLVDVRIIVSYCVKSLDIFWKIFF